MSFLDRFRRKKEDEAARLARLLNTGRITEGKVLDVKVDERGHVIQIFYSYVVAGVEYESAHELNADQATREASYAAGARIIIRYDLQQPANSVVV